MVRKIVLAVLLAVQFGVLTSTASALALPPCGGPCSVR